MHSRSVVLVTMTTAPVVTLLPPQAGNNCTAISSAAQRLGPSSIVFWNLATNLNDIASSLKSCPGIDTMFHLYLFVLLMVLVASFAE
jgi:hypothetical protein